MILCCRLDTLSAGTAWVSALPVCLEDWGQFVRSGEYFNDAHWQHPRRRAPGADAILARIGYRWPDRHRPVGSITWHEAQAYSAASGGRLPWLEEWQALRAAFSRLDWMQMRGVKSWLPEAGRESFGSACDMEWCGDPYNATALGPHVRAERPLRRRITGGPECMVPDAHHERLGLRVAFEKTSAASRSYATGWEWIEPPPVASRLGLSPTDRSGDGRSCLGIRARALRGMRT